MKTLYIERSTGECRDGSWVEKLDLEGVERIVVGTGPGSFAGIRSALAFAQGYALGKKCEVLGLPSACALAADYFASESHPAPSTKHPAPSTQHPAPIPTLCRRRRCTAGQVLDRALRGLSACLRHLPGGSRDVAVPRAAGREGDDAGREADRCRAEGGFRRVLHRRRHADAGRSPAVRGGQSGHPQVRAASHLPQSRRQKLKGYA